MKIINELTYAQRERLIFIELCLTYLGEISRVELINKFRIGAASATRDFATYKELVPANMELIHSSKTYHRTSQFKPLFEHEPETILHELSCGFGMPYPNQLQHTCINQVDLVNPAANIISVVMRAIVKSKALRCVYVSLASGSKKRIIIPHSFVNNGQRWHVRAYDRNTNSFKDFVVTRFKKLEVIDSDIIMDEMKESDNQWNRVVDLTLIPHPKLHLPEAVELDYSMKNGQLIVQVRAALAGYMLNQWNVDCSESYKLNPNQYHLALKERAALFAVQNAELAPGYQEISNEK